MTLPMRNPSALCRTGKLVFMIYISEFAEYSLPKAADLSYYVMFFVFFMSKESFLSSNKYFPCEI